MRVGGPQIKHTNKKKNTMISISLKRRQMQVAITSQRLVPLNMRCMVFVRGE